MNYADIKPNDINNGEGLVVSLWVSGCPIKCEGCHNEAIWDYTSGEEFTEETLNYLVDLLSDPRVDKGLSILGGEPLAPENYSEVLNVVKHVREKFPTKSIWLWTGYEYSRVEPLEILNYLDVIITGRYIESLKDTETWWRGSLNQKKIHLTKSK